MRALGLSPARSAVVACTDAFAHANGVSADAATKLPSLSKAYKSVAKAIVARDPAKFTPGTPNTDWRKHARFRAPK